MAERWLRQPLHQRREKDARGQDLPPLEQFSPSDEALFAQAMQQRPKDFCNAGLLLRKSTKACVAYYYSAFKTRSPLYPVRVIALF